MSVQSKSLSYINSKRECLLILKCFDILINSQDENVFTKHGRNILDKTKKLTITWTSGYLFITINNNNDKELIKDIGIKLLTRFKNVTVCNLVHDTLHDDENAKISNEIYSRRFIQ